MSADVAANAEAILRSASVAQRLAAHLKVPKTAIQIRNGFVAIGHTPLPTGLRLLRSSSKDSVHFRLFLALLCLLQQRAGTDEGPRATFRMDDLSALAGLDPGLPATPRRIKRSLLALDDAGLVRISATGGGAVTLELQSEIWPHQPEGDPRIYCLPGIDATEGNSPANAYLRVRQGLVLNGWLARLSGRAVLVYMAFQYLKQTNRDSESTVYINENLRNQRFGFGEEMLYRATHELLDADLLTRHMVVVEPDETGPQFRRATYDLRSWVLSKPADRWWKGKRSADEFEERIREIPNGELARLDAAVALRTRQ